jgi:diguanylate cyclase (GGDEF)-like protein/PAS domain S-box-containing protein
VLVGGVTHRGGASLAVITDVTALNATRRKLAESEARYRSLIEDQSELVALAAPDGELRFVNRAYAQFYDRLPEEMVGRSLYELVAEAHRAGVAEHLHLVCRTRASLQHENQVELPDGRTRWIAWTNRALTDEMGEVVAIHSVGRDIDRRVRAERRLAESEANYRLLAENSTDMILLVRLDGVRVYASPACRSLLGYEPSEMLEISTAEALHPDDAGPICARLARNEGAIEPRTYRMRRKDGGYVWVEAISRSVAQSPGQPPQRLVVARDVDERVRAEQRLMESEARYRLLAEHSSDLIVQLDRDLVRRYVSPACRDMLGYEPDELVGIESIAMAHPDDAQRMARVFGSLLSGREDRQMAVSRIRHRNGSWVWVEAQLQALKDPHTGQPTGIVGALRDISARREVEERLAEATRRLEALAGEDGLTGLANRRSFDEALARDHARARREKTPFALIMIDVDFFKPFNDRYGHPAGDDCLRRISAAIRNTIRRPGDRAARYGGEEFAVLLANADEAGAAVVAERIRHAVLRLEIPHEASPNRNVTVSLGLASVEAQAAGEGPERLLREADAALYRAKRSGRNAIARASQNPAAAAGPLHQDDIGLSPRSRTAQVDDAL